MFRIMIINYPYLFFFYYVLFLFRWCIVDFLNLPDEAYQWLTSEINELLKKIQGPEVTKKRTTIIKLAFAHAQNKSLKEVFEDKSVCSESIWYRKWKHNPDIKAAYDACCERVLMWNDEYTAAIEVSYRLRRKQLIAQHATDAPLALSNIMNDPEQKGGDRIEAATRLMEWADPDDAAKISSPSPSMSGSGITQNFDFSKLSNEELNATLASVTSTSQLSPSSPKSPPTDNA